MTNILQIILMSPPADGAKGGSSLMSLLPILLIIVVFYFFMIRPNMKKNKELKKFRENLKKGDRVVTIGGIHGKIVEVQDATIIIEVEGGVKIKFEKSAIALNAESAQIPENS